MVLRAKPSCVLSNPNSRRNDPGFEARNLALTILLKVELEGSYANIALPAALRKASLESRDSAFATELVYGTLRRRTLYDAIIERASSRKISKIDSIPLSILRLTAHQLLTMETPPHAAVDSAVRLSVRNKSGSASGFVNAISRRISERNQSEWISELTPELDQVAKLALEYAHPRWIVENYLGRLGDIQLVERELRANNVNPEVTAVIYPGFQWSTETESESLPCTWSSACRYIRGNPEHLPEIRRGSGGIQDQGSYLVAQALALAPTMPRQAASYEPLWLDMCAGPGGKAALLSRWAQEGQASFLAMEISEHRADLIKRVCPTIVVADGNHPPIAPASASKILLDAPCSGLGALRRRPDARHRKSPSDIKELVALQRELLSSAHALLAQGGILAYVTCSPAVEESSENKDWFLHRFPDMELLDARSFFPTSMELADSFDVQLWPGVHNTDAIYLAMFQKKREPR